jgi:hypothetical protein
MKNEEEEENPSKLSNPKSGEFFVEFNQPFALFPCEKFLFLQHK